MNKIKILSTDTINKIAAGEVIERPASVVKELVENSLDAGAKYITVKIKASGKELISVSDDGCGMSKEDALLSIERHSTSKISDATDLEKVHTLGFRGEALPSIASISSMKIMTKCQHFETGFCLEVEHGILTVSKDIGVANGTTIEIKNIFKNVPARLKFLKTDNTEKNKIISILTDYAIVNFDVAFSLMTDGKELFSYSPANNLKTRISQVFGNEFLGELIEVQLQHKQISIYGFTNKPNTNVPCRNRIFLSVNKRPINSRMIVSAVKNGYGEFLKRNETPSFFLMLGVNPDIIDVNVHPTKREIKFKDEGAIYSLIYQTIKNHIITKEVVSEIFYGDRSVHKFGVGIVSEPFISGASGVVSSRACVKISTTLTHGNDIDAQTQFAEANSMIRYIGQIFGLYILASDCENFYFVDQHAAQEKILYEKFRKIVDDKKPEIQNLLIPINIELSPQEFDIFSTLKNDLEKLGFYTEQFGKSSYIIKSVPSIIGDKSIENMIVEIIKNKKIGAISGASEKIVDDIIKTACTTAIKSGDKVSDVEATKLLEELFECANPYTCPHGRPTIIKITKGELDKRFRRE